MEYSDHRPTQAIIDLAAIRHNIQVIQAQHAPDQAIYITVKANGYGHGATQVAKAAMQAGATGICVATVDEGIHLRKHGFSGVPILVLGLTNPMGIAEILHYNLTVTVSGVDFFKQAYQQLEETAQIGLLNFNKLTFHLGLDTGMGRIGLRHVQEVQDFAAQVGQYDWVDWEGVFTHFATAGGGATDYIQTQYDKWLELNTAVPSAVSLRHIANSAMGSWYTKYPTDIVRLGISAYGLDPKDQPENPVSSSLRPALSLISEIVYIKQVQAGSAISYGATYVAEEDEWIATVPIGYADGWFRRYSQAGVIVDGCHCPVVGTINMDQLMIKVPRPYSVGTEVTLIGRDHKVQITASDIAAVADTIGYEVLTGIGPRVPRVYLD